ncbi:transposase [Rudanella lutea]|uniref:transposase n=1 Tax=Rudanella lutea TaxID=451374 RepID=UPI00037CE3E2|nr:transposase [Rudanella lutea]
MNPRSKRKFTPQFKLKVVLEVLKEKETLTTISKRYELHPNQIREWKKQFLESAASVFGNPAKPLKQEADAETAQLCEQIGRLQMELVFFKKS